MRIDKKQTTYEIRIRAVKAKSDGLRIKDISKVHIPRYREHPFRFIVNSDSILS